MLELTRTPAEVDSDMYTKTTSTRTNQSQHAVIMQRGWTECA